MSELRSGAEPPIPDPGFQLLVHVGAGKTGSSSIQRTLRASMPELARQGVDYLGLMLECSAKRRHAWQAAKHIKDFLNLPDARQERELHDVLLETVQALRAKGSRLAVWSNEALIGQGDKAVGRVLARLAEQGIVVRVIVYIRRHDAWARSAYIQWGLKHKTYAGSIRPFGAWIANRAPRFMDWIEPWQERLGADVLVRNLDAVSDVVDDFLSLCGVKLNQPKQARANQAPSAEELALRVLWNEQFDGKVAPHVFDRLIGDKPLSFDRDAATLLATLLPDAAALQSLVGGSSKDRATLDKLLTGSGQAPVATGSLAEQSRDVDTGKLLTAICQLVLRQAHRLDQLEAKQAAAQELSVSAHPQAVVPPHTAVSPSLPAPAAKPMALLQPQPVFVISTGRSGSTLVQRLLNCHRDLVVWGEHYGFLNGLASAYVQMSNPDQKQFPRKPEENASPGILLPTLQDPAAPIEWANPWALTEYKSQLKDFIAGYFGGRSPEGVRWGFKEIRYNVMPTLRMLHDVFPRGRFVFVRRDPLEVTRSKVFAFIKEAKWEAFALPEKQRRIEAMVREVVEHYAVYDMFMNRYPTAGLVVDYEDLVERPAEVLEQMCQFAELPLGRLDRALAKAVMGSVITKTKRDDDVSRLIQEVAAPLLAGATANR